MWSLAVEVAFYVALPLLAYLLMVLLCRRQWRPGLLLAGLGGLFLISPAWLVLVHTTDFLPDGAKLWLPGYLAWFLGGMLLTVLAAMKVRVYWFVAVPWRSSATSSSAHRSPVSRRPRRPAWLRHWSRWRSTR